MKFLSLPLLVIFAICEAKYDPSMVPDYYAAVDAHLKSQLPKIVQGNNKYFKYAAEDIAVVEKNLSDAESQLASELDSFSQIIAEKTLTAVKDAPGSQVSDEKQLTKQVQDSVSKLASEFVEAYKTTGKAVRTIKSDVLASESLVADVVNREIPKLINDFANKMKPEQSKKKAQQYVEELKGSGREAVVAIVRQQFQKSESEEILKIKREVSVAVSQALGNIVTDLKASLKQVVDENVKDNSEEVLNKLLSEAYGYLEAELGKSLQAGQEGLNKAESIAVSTADSVVDQVDYQIKRMAMAVSASLMAYF